MKNTSDNNNHVPACGNQTSVNTQEILNVLLECDWDYQYNGWAPDASKMAGFVSDIEDGLSLEVVKKAMIERRDQVAEVIGDFDETKNNSLSLHQQVAITIADTVGQMITGCNGGYHEAVTFTVS